MTALCSPESPALAAAAGDDWSEGVEDTAASPAPAGPPSDDALDLLCERLAWWSLSRKLYGAPRGPVSLLGKLRGGSRPVRDEGAWLDSTCSAELAALYIAVLAQPAEALDRVVFDLHYFARVKSVKEAAGLLQIGRPHWYTLLRQFRRRIYRASREIMALNEATASKLPSLRLYAASVDNSKATPG